VAAESTQVRKDAGGTGAAHGRPATRPRRQKSAAGGTPHAGQAAAAARPAAADGASGQKLFERAITAYRKDDCRTALELFDRFLSAHPSSPLAADATLYKAECYLKQSGQ
jgi:TolA-binding protein